MSSWEITVGKNEPKLYVELNGKPAGYFGNTFPIRAIKAEPDDDLDVYTTSGLDNYGGPVIEARIASGKVRELARRI